VLTRAQVCGWNHIFTIPVTDFVTVTTKSFNLLSQHGLAPILAVRTDALTFCATPSKHALDSFMACQCLLGLLTLDFLKIISADSISCHLPPIVAMNGAVPSGPLLLKLIIRQAHVDSRATASFIRNSLTELDTKMLEPDSNIVKFNLCVAAQVKALSHRGETAQDLLTNLFKGCKAS
jgi:hypothetical protein